MRNPKSKEVFAFFLVFFRGVFSIKQETSVGFLSIALNSYYKGRLAI
jgi:hypothetical protein